jgi:hypothetical protein
MKRKQIKINALSFLFVVLVAPSIYSQNIPIDVDYAMRKVDNFNKKVGIAIGMEFNLDDEKIESFFMDGSFYHWQIEGSGIIYEAYFNSKKEEGIWWEIKSKDESIIVLLSPNQDDTNDPRDFKVTSTKDRAVFKIFNEEPDCNSEFALVEVANSPTNLMGIARSYATIRNLKPCWKGKWEVEIENETPDHIMLAFIFASIQSLNVRYLDEL